MRSRLGAKPPAEVVRFLNMLIYGEPGAGKTHLSGTAEDHKDTSPVLFLDVEGGVTTLRKRKTLDVVPVRSLGDISKIHEELYKDEGKTYKTVVIDSLTELQKLDMREIMQAAYAARPDRVDPDVPSQREWGKSGEHVRKIVRAFRDLPCNTIITCHSVLDVQEGQPSMVQPSLPGKLKNEIPGFMDIVGYLYVEQAANGARTWRVQFAKTRRVVAKDRTNALGDVVENPTIPVLWELIHMDSQSTTNGGKSK